MTGSNVARALGWGRYWLRRRRANRADLVALRAARPARGPSGCRRERCGSGDRARDLFSARASLPGRNRPSAGGAPWDNPARQCCCNHCIRRSRYQEAGSSLRIAPLPARLYTSMLLLALTNPMTILPYLAASTVADDIPLFSGASLLGAAGAMVGALSCYSALSGATIACRQALAGAAATHVNLAAGVLLIAFGGSIALGCL